MHSVIYDIYTLCNIHKSENSYFVRIFKYKISQKEKPNIIHTMLFIICLSLYTFHATLSDVRHYAKILQWALIVRPHLLVRWRGPVSCNQSLEMSPSQGRVTAKVSVVFAQHFQT